MTQELLINCSFSLLSLVRWKRTLFAQPISADRLHLQNFALLSLLEDNSVLLGRNQYGRPCKDSVSWNATQFYLIRMTSELLDCLNKTFIKMFSVCSVYFHGTKRSFAWQKSVFYTSDSHQKC